MDHLTGTKKKILDVSLELFSVYGYNAVSMEQIAESVQIKAPSVYKHFKSKQDIFDSIFAVMEEKYDEQTAEMQLHIRDGETDFAVFRDISEEMLYAKVEELVFFSLHDEYNSKFRRLLTTHQYTDPKIAVLYTERYVNMLIRYHTALFSKMIEAKVFVPGDAEMMAWQYVAPVYSLIGVCDREPERENECMELIKRHIHQFNQAYRSDLR